MTHTSAPAFTCWRDPSHEVEFHPIWGWPRCKDCRAAPPYHQRQPRVNLYLDIVVPNPSTRGGAFLASTIAPHSAIVARRFAGAGDVYNTLVSYEGWTLGGPEGLSSRERWNLGLLHAADRMITEYPTVAQATCKHDDVLTIGLYDPALNDINIDDEDTLAKWLETA